MRIYTYIRVSTDQQAKFGESLEDQQAALRRWAEENDCVIIREYIDAGRTAYEEYRKRPAFCRMLADSKIERPDRVCFTRLDRFARNQRDYHNVVYDFRKEGLEWIAIWLNCDSTTPEGRLVASMLMACYEGESANTSARIIAHNKEKRLRGELVSGKVPRGYMIQDKHPVKDPTTQPGVHAFWRTYLSGQGLSASIHAAELHGVHLGISSASYMLRNAAAYAGTIQGIPCQDTYLTEEEAAQILAKRKKPIRRTGRTYLFSGFIYCGECGRAMGAHSHKLKTGSYIYYNCTGHYRDPSSCSCRVNLYERDIESHLLDQLERGLLSLLEQAKKDQTDPKIAENMRRRITNLNQQKARLLDVFLDGIIEKEEFESRRRELEVQIRDYSLKLKEIEHKKIPGDLSEILPENWKKIYSELDIEHRREFWFGILKEVKILPDRTITFIPQT